MQKTTFVLIAFLFLRFTATSQAVVQWAKNIGSADNEYPTKICADGQGNCYVAGAYSKTLSVCNDTLVEVRQTLNSNGAQNLFISKFDSLGNCIWTKTGVLIVPLLNSGNVGPEITDMKYFDGRLYCIGGFTDSIIFDNDTLFNPTCPNYCTTPFIIVFDAVSGSVSWSKCFEGSTTYSGISSVVPYSGGVFIAGTYENYLTVDTVTLHPPYTYGYAAYILKFNHTGQAVWGKHIGLSTNSYIGSMVFDNDKNLYMAGGYADTIIFPNDTIWDIMPGYERATFFTKYDTLGNYVWSRGGRPLMRAFFRSTALCYANNGNLYFAGSYDDTTRIGATTLTTPLNFYRDAIIKIDPNGQFLWAKATGNRYFSQGFPSAIAANSRGFMLFSSFGDTTILGPDTLFSNGSLDDLLTQYDFDGNIIYYKHFGGISQEIAKDVYCTGQHTYFTARTMSDYTIDSCNIANVFAGDVLVARMADSTIKAVATGAYHIDRETSFVVYPNPSTGAVIITGETEIKEIAISNYLGETVFTGKPNATSVTLHLPASGLYVATIFNGQYYQTRKIIIVRP
jgi:hypothetical protein